jgi:hypothetical protein
MIVQYLKYVNVINASLECDADAMYLPSFSGNLPLSENNVFQLIAVLHTAAVLELRTFLNTHNIIIIDSFIGSYVLFDMVKSTYLENVPELLGQRILE